MKNWIPALAGKAKLAVILGSGLSPTEGELSSRELISYSDTDILPEPTVKGHPGKILLFHNEAGNSIYLFAGRSHLYEGVSVKEAGAGVYLAAELGCEKILLVHAAGSLKSDLPPGSWLAPANLVAFPFRRKRYGGAVESEDSCARGAAISRSFRECIVRAAGEVLIQVQNGTLMWTQGPCYETRAEGLAAIELGADAVTMSIMPELAAALDAGVETAVLSWITNYTPNVRGVPVSHEEVIRKGEEARRILFSVLNRF